MNNEPLIIKITKKEAENLMEHLKNKKLFLEEQGYKLVRKAEVKLVVEGE